MKNSVKIFLGALLFLMLFLQGCLNTYLSSVTTAVKGNINYFKGSANVEKDKIEVYDPSGTTNEIDLSENACYYGSCNYFLCHSDKDVDDSERKNDPYFYIYGRNLSGENYCGYGRIPSISKALELRFAYLYKTNMDSDGDYRTFIRRLSVSMGDTFYEFNNANPSCKNYLDYPTFYITGNDKHYFLSPTVKEAIRRANEKNVIPVIIFLGNGDFPENYLLDTEKIMDWLTSNNLKSIVFTQANIELSKRPLDINKKDKKDYEKLEKVANQLNKIYQYCKPDGIEESMSASEYLDRSTHVKCMPGISIPFNGKDPSYSYEFFKKIQIVYGDDLGYEWVSKVPGNGNVPFDAFRGTRFYDFYTFVGYPLITSKASDCSGYALVSDAVEIAKKFLLNTNDPNKVTPSFERVSHPVFLQGLVFDKSADCEFGETLRKQTYFALFNYAVPAFSKAGIVNIPSKSYHLAKLQDLKTSSDFERAVWAVDDIVNRYSPYNREEYSFFFSYCQSYYDEVNYPNMVNRGGYGTETCPFETKITEIKYQRENRGRERNIDKLFDVNPSTLTNVFEPFYRAESCFFNTSNINTFFSPSSDVIISSGIASSCYDPTALKINQYVSKYAGDIDLAKSIRGYMTGNIQCRVEFERQSKCPTGMEYNEINPLLKSAGCNEINEEYFYDEELKTCMPESSFISYDSNGNPVVKPTEGERCVPCYYGTMRVSYNNKDLSTIEGTPAGLYSCGGSNYNPFNEDDNICSAAIRLTAKSERALEVVDNPGRYGLNTNIEDEEKGVLAAYFTAYLYRQSRWIVDFDESGIYDIEALRKINNLYSKARQIAQSSDKDAACSAADDETKEICCRVVPSTDQNGNVIYESEYDPSGCCTTDKTDNLKKFISTCDRGPLKFPLTVLRSYKSTVQTCNYCFSLDWKRNACDYSKGITDAKGCDGSYNLVNPDDNAVDIYNKEKDINDYELEEIKKECQKLGLKPDCTP